MLVPPEAGSQLLRGRRSWYCPSLAVDIATHRTRRLHAVLQKFCYLLRVTCTHVYLQIQYRHTGSHISQSHVRLTTEAPIIPSGTPVSLYVRVGSTSGRMHKVHQAEARGLRAKSSDWVVGMRNKHHGSLGDMGLRCAGSSA